MLASKHTKLIAASGFEENTIETQSYKYFFVVIYNKTVFLGLNQVYY
jgi:hypothetical protein